MGYIVTALVSPKIIATGATAPAAVSVAIGKGWREEEVVATAATERLLAFVEEFGDAPWEMVGDVADLEGDIRWAPGDGAPGD